MKNIKWPYVAIVVVVAAIAGTGVALWMRNEPITSAEEMPFAARIQRVDGEVAFSDGLANTGNTTNSGYTSDGNTTSAENNTASADRADGEWIAATPNQPFSVGDRIYTRDNSRTSLAFSGRNFARLDPNTSLDVVSLDERRTQLALREGSAIFDVGYLQPNEVFEVATPYGAVNFDEPGLYNVGFDDNGGVLVSVLSGLAQVAGLAGSGEINKGEFVTLLGQTAAEIALSRLNRDEAAYMVDDYYRYQYPSSYDGRYNNYDAYLSDPYYYDPYRRNVSYQYASSAIPGLNDLDYYGDWQSVDGYGHAWRPRVDAGWVPYQDGQWTNDYPYGPTWVSSEPWGYAPYHYGRWVNTGSQWYWIPDAVNTTPMYAPALVAFVPLDDAGQIGWVPLGPGDVYAPRYYDDNWQPNYVTRANVVPAQLINLNVPGAVTVISVDAFARPIDRHALKRIEKERLASLRPTLDPLTLTPLRNAVVHSAWGRGKVQLPPGIAKKLRETPVFIGRDFKESRFNKHLAKSMRVERVSGKDRDRKFAVRTDNDDQALQPSRRVEQARKHEIERLNGEALKGNKEAKQQVKQIEQQQRKGRDEQKRAAPQTVPQAQGERVGNPGKQNQPRAEQQSPGASKQERKQERKQEQRGQAGGKGEKQGGGKGKGKP